MLRKLLMSTVVVFGATGIASAADLPTTKGEPIYAPPPPIFTWTGLYIGAQAGYQFGHSSTSSGGGFPGYNPSGVDGGAHIGYNYQVGQFVAGLEGDVNGSSYHGSNAFGALTAYNTTENVDGSLRGRFGVTWDRALIYATGGAAFGNFRNQYVSGLGADTLWNTRVGWTVGGGVEYALDNNWSLRAEYRYTDYPGFTEFAANSLGANVYKHETDNRVQLGVSYKFDLMGPAQIPTKY